MKARVDNYLKKKKREMILNIIKENIPIILAVVAIITGLITFKVLKRKAKKKVKAKIRSSIKSGVEEMRARREVEEAETEE